MARTGKPIGRPKKRFDDPSVLMALDLYVGALFTADDKRITGNKRAVAREMGVHRRTMDLWIEAAWWNVLGCEPTASNEAANAAYWKKVAAEGHSADLDNAYRQLQAQRGIILDPQPEN